MKTFNIVFTWLFAFLSLTFATTPKGAILEQAAREAGQRAPTIGVRYAIYVYSPPDNLQQQCVPGWSHVKLVAGEYNNYPGESDFDGRFYDMTKAGTPQSGGSYRPIGGTTIPRMETWQISAGDKYQWAGQVKDSQAVVDQAGESILSDTRTRDRYFWRIWL